MKSLLALLLIFIASVTPGYCEKLELFVSPTCSDGDPGTEAGQFRSLERARDAVRGLRRDREVVVSLKGGVFEREKKRDWLYF